MAGLVAGGLSTWDSAQGLAEEAPSGGLASFSDLLFCARLKTCGWATAGQAAWGVPWAQE